MTDAQRRAWKFACENTDYWPLLKGGDDDPPEVVALMGEEREAFEAARIEIQRKYTAVLRACWSELLARWHAAGRAPYFNRERWGKTLLTGELISGLPKNKGSLAIGLYPWDANALWLSGTIWTAKKRVNHARAILVADHFYEEDQMFYVGVCVDPEREDADLASALHDLLFLPLLKWLDADEVGDAGG